MMPSRFFFVAALIATAAVAQQRPIFDPDDFLDPRQYDGIVISSRLVLGAEKNGIDDYRPLRGDAGFVQFGAALYRKGWQFDYKHVEMRGNPPPVTVCDCKPPLYFPTPAPDDATPEAPPLGSRNTLQLGLYLPKDRGPGQLPAMLRYRLSFSLLQTNIPVRSAVTGDIVDHRSSRDQSIGIDADTNFHLGKHEMWGSVAYARTSQHAITTRTQQELTYTARPRGWPVGPVLARATLTVGGVSNRGGTAVNVVNPALEAFWHSHATRVNVHLVWSPQTTRDGESGWRTRNQVAAFVDYGYVWLLKR
jgi:hypothetical protein